MICTWEFDLDHDRVSSDKFAGMEKVRKMQTEACQVVEVASEVQRRAVVDSLEVQGDQVERYWVRLAAVEHHLRPRPVT